MSHINMDLDYILSSLENHTFIHQYDVIKYEYTITKFQLKLRIECVDGSVLFTNEYVSETIRKYAFQWQKADNTWLIRWDNAPHYPKLTSFPHHKHDYRNGSETITESFDISLTDVLGYIHSQLISS